MHADSPNWRDHFGEPASPNEQAALETLRKLLPDTETIAWPNVTFMDNQGNANEVDVILLCPQGLFVVELKGWGGHFEGDQFFWQVGYPGGRREERKNPFTGTRMKAQRLASQLADAKRQAKLPNLRIPFVGAIVVMHGQGSTFAFKGNAAEHIYRLDGYQVTGLTAFSDILKGIAGDSDPIDAQTRAATAQLFDRLGLRARPKVRMVGQYKITDSTPLSTGPGWEDYAVVHPALGDIRRLRLFPIPPKASKAQTAAIHRAAKREYRLTSGLHQPGIVSALDYIETDAAAAVVFPEDVPGEQTLDRHLAENDSTLDLADRLKLVQDLAEILQYAHKNGVFHRAVTPSVVRVGNHGLMLRDWQAGAADTDDDSPDATALAGLTNVAGAADQDSWVYLAPEAHTAAHPDGRAMDVYGLGAMAYLIFTGQPPAADLPDLQAKLAQGGLDPSAVADMPDDLAAMIEMATAPSVSDRTAMVDDVIDELADVQRKLADEQQASDAIDPLDAAVCDLIDGRWIVEAILGKGSTGRALRVSGNDDKPFVFKVAVSEDKADALIAEADTLATLDHPLVVKAIGQPMEIHGRTCVAMEYAGEPLSRTLREDGRLTLERLETFGADLLEIGHYLSDRGVNHRDIKPDNLGIRPDPGDRRPRLVIFDFSLSRRPVDDISSGTRPYLDPFLGPAFRRRAYDSAAERFAIAVSLFEMAAGRQPTWGDGQTAPQHAELTISADMFEGPRTELMADFFGKALAKDVKQRFDDIDTMARAWQQLFIETLTATVDTEVTVEERDRAAERATRTTALIDAGLSARAVSAARRLGGETVNDVMGMDPVRINQIQGAGLRTRQELQRRRRQWLELLTEQTWVQDTPEVGRAIEQLRSALVPKSNGKNVHAVTLATAFSQDSRWSAIRDLASAAGLSPAEATTAFVLLRRHWARNVGLDQVRGEIDAVVASGNGISTVTEIAQVLLARHGSQLEDTQDRINATIPVIRAALAARDDADDVLNRLPGSPVILVGRASDSLPDPDSVMQSVRTAAPLLDEAVATDPCLIPAAEVDSLLGAVARSSGLPPARFVRLAAACSKHAQVSTRGEVYAEGLPAQVTVPRVLNGLGKTVLSERTLHERVQRRYPAAAALPTRPAIDALVTAAMPGMVWDGTNYAKPVSASLLSSSTMYTSLAELQVSDHVALHARLQDSLATRSGLVIGVDPRFVQRAADWLQREFGVIELSLGSQLIAAAKEFAAAKHVPWRTLLISDAQQAGVSRSRLNQFMAAAVDTFWEPALSTPDPLLLTDAAVLARYGLAERLAPLTDLGVAKPAARWILVPHRSASAYPTLDGTPVPLAADGWLDLPPGVFTPAMPKGA